MYKNEEELSTVLLKVIQLFKKTVAADLVF